MVQKIKQKFISIFASLFLLFLPIFVWAGSHSSYFREDGGGPVGPPDDLKSFVEVILGLISLIIPVLVGLTLLVFLWGLTKYILALSGGAIIDKDGKKSKDPVSDAKRLMIWGIISLFVMVSVWGILSILVGSLGYGFGFPQLRTN